jgi:hypothetical protein
MIAGSMGLSTPLRMLVVVALTAALAACGDSTRHAGGTRAVTVPAYGVFPATTLSSTTSDEQGLRACRIQVDAFLDGARLFLAHSGQQAAYPADLYYVILREALADLTRRGCDPALLGSALARGLTLAQRRALLAGLPAATADRVRKSLRRAGARAQ